jgi:hypothetical protein
MNARAIRSALCASVRLSGDRLKVRVILIAFGTDNFECVRVRKELGAELEFTFDLCVDDFDSQ